ncbi:MAG: zf-HC2 domain-containing protein [Anaerolineae bacterium]
MMKRKQPNLAHSLHQQVAQLLSAYLDGQVDARERYLVEQHLSTCPVCRHDLESLRQTVRLLRQLPAVTPPHPFTLRPGWVAPTRPLIWRWLFGIPGLATGLATLLCVITVAGVLLYNRLVPYSSVRPLARAPVTYGIPVAPTVVFVPGVTSTTTPVAPSPVAVRDELSLPAETSVPTPTQMPPIPSQPVELFAAPPLPSPESVGEEHETLSPTPPVTQPEPKSLATAQPSPQRTEVPGKAPIEEEMSAQRYESTVSPEPLWTVPSVIEVTTAPPATATPTAPPPAEGIVLPSEPSSAIVAAAMPTIEISATPTPSVEKVVPSPEPSPAVETVAVPAETSATPSPTEKAEGSIEPSPTTEATTVPPTGEIPAAPTEAPAELSPTEAVAVSAEPLHVTEATTEAPAAPAETLTVSPPEEEAPTSKVKEIEPVIPTAVESGTQEAPSISPTEPEPTPTRIPISVRDLRLTIKPGLIRIEGALPLPPGQLIQAELWREEQLVEWAIPETQRGKVQEEGRFELELKAQPDHPDFDLFRIPPARYEVRIVPLEFGAPVEARIPFETFPPATKQP